jgi:hypothetical protein
MGLLNKYVAAAEENGWHVEIDGNYVVASRENLKDGYPCRLSCIIDGNTMTDGIIVNDYGSGPEEFKAGRRYHIAVLENVQHPLRYKRFYDAFLATQPLMRSEKVLAERTGYSERQIRKARMCGFADDMMIDTLCVRVLSIHPANIYGYDNWVAGVDLSELDIDEMSG